MHIGIICSNYHPIAKETANGTAIFAYSLIEALARHAREDSAFSATVFASADSAVSLPVESIGDGSLRDDAALAQSGRHFLYEQALIGTAFSRQDAFDLYHVHMGDGDIAVPFAPFVRKPILITLHFIRPTEYMRRFFSLYREQKNVWFVAASDAQRQHLPDLQYAATIHHGIDPEAFAFSQDGGDELMWAGRAIPEKGPDHVVAVATKAGRGAKLFGILRTEHEEWLREVLDGAPGHVRFTSGLSRHELIEHFQTSKAFMLPVSYEESFGLVFIEAMSCGTPVIAYAQGAVSEVVEDGVTGFIVNRSDDDIRGEWIIKKTGIDGLHEAVERIYAMSPEEYRAMRLACRQRVLERFTIDRMTQQYLDVYARLTG